MYTQESVLVEYAGYTVTADVQMEDGVGIDVVNIYLHTDTTAPVNIHQSDLTQKGLRDLFTEAERLHDAFVEGDL